MNPRLILAAIVGGASGVATAVVTGAGLVATPSPGSIFAYMAVTPTDGYFGVLLAIAVACGVSFARRLDAARLRPRGTAGRRGRAAGARRRLAAADPTERDRHARGQRPGHPHGGHRLRCRDGQQRHGRQPDASAAEEVRRGGRARPRQLDPGRRPGGRLPRRASPQRARGMAPGAVVVPFQMFMGDPAFERVEAAIRDGGVLAG